MSPKITAVLTTVAIVLTVMYAVAHVKTLNAFING